MSIDSYRNERFMDLLSLDAHGLAVRPEIGNGGQSGRRIGFGVSYERENKDLKRIRGMNTPLLVIHGEKDEVIPVSHGRKLVEASLATDKHFSMVAGAGHNDLFEIAGEGIIQQVAEFARRVKR